MKTCPDCDGQKRGPALLSVLRDGQRRCEARTLDCSTCRGSGEVTEEHAERLRKGEEMRQDRLRRGLSGREEAKRLGIDPITLNHMEHGREA